MADSTKGNITVRGVYRSHSHVPIWEVIEKAHIWEQVGIEPTRLEYCESPPDAEAALFDGSIDFISGNHLTPYVLVAEGKPIVSIASPVYPLALIQAHASPYDIHHVIAPPMMKPSIPPL